MNFDHSSFRNHHRMFSSTGSIAAVKGDRFAGLYFAPDGSSQTTATMLRIEGRSR